MKICELTLKILRLCEKIDMKAAAIYHYFSETEKDTKLKNFWEQMSHEEKGHVNAWRFLIDLTLKGETLQIFENNHELIEDLESAIPNIDLHHAESKTNLSKDKKFEIACHLELIMLNRSFINAFYLIKSIKKDDEYINDYEKHLMNLFEILEEYDCLIQLSGIIKILKRLWQDNKKLVVTTNEDYLTGIFNRRGFFNTTIPVAHMSYRNNSTVAVMMTDLDKFKLINDKYGHQVGDKVLASSAKIIKNLMRRSDIVGRYGGEEFVIFLPQTDPEYLFSIAENIRKTIEQENKKRIPITISIGIAYKTFKGNIEKEVYELINIADNNLYKAKQSGRNRVIMGEIFPN